MGTYNMCLSPACGGSVLLASDDRHVCTLCAREYKDGEIYGGYDGPGPQFGWTHIQRITAFTLWHAGRTWAEIGAEIGKRPEAVRKYFQRNPPGDHQEVKNKIADSAMAMALSQAGDTEAKMTTYDHEDHLLLRDVAHQRCIHQNREFDAFVQRVGEAGYAPFEVEVPDWPPVMRTPLPIIVFGIGIGDGGGGVVHGGPTAALSWEGRQLAIERTWQSRREARGIAKDMAPSRMEPAHRIAYAWQVEEFDSETHAVIRYWCRDNQVDIVNFWLQFYPDHDGELNIVETTNPEVYAEIEKGSYSPTRRCVLRSQLYLLRNHYLGTAEGPPDDPGPDPAPRDGRPQPRAVHDGQDQEEETVRWSIHDGAVAYPFHEALAALEAALGRDARPFSGTGLDETVMAITPEAMARYLAANPVDQRQYVRDSGGRNYDCDDFALTLRSNLIRDHGYNCCAVIAGDVHAFNAFILAGENGPEIAFVEPQTDGLVAELTGDYSVSRRCETVV